MSIEQDAASPTTTSRRTLLKGAVAAGVGVAVYNAPVISSIPAYASLSSISSNSGILCLGFSPNHESQGDWHLPTAMVTAVNPSVGFQVVQGSYHHGPLNGSQNIIKVQFYVGGQWREMWLTGHPNNLKFATTQHAEPL